MDGTAARWEGGNERGLLHKRQFIIAGARFPPSVHQTEEAWSTSVRLFPGALFGRPLHSRGNRNGLRYPVRKDTGNPEEKEETQPPPTTANNANPFAPVCRFSWFPTFVVCHVYHTIIVSSCAGVVRCTFTRAHAASKYRHSEPADGTSHRLGPDLPPSSTRLDRNLGPTISALLARLSLHM